MDQEDARRDSSEDLSARQAGYLSQLLMLSKKPLFTKSGLYACLTFFSFGLMSILPGVSQIQPSILASEDKYSGAIATVEQTGKNTEERCRLQADVMLFLSLQEQKSNISQSTVPCEEKAPVLVKKEEKTIVRSDKTLSDLIQEMTAGYPIERMAPAIAQYDRGVAALIVGIAKKESDWGKHVPLDESGADCFNYWGYKGAGTRGVAMGHGCFGSPEEAVTAVGDRLTELVALRQTSEPANMIIWKCGSSCKGHTDVSVKKWISDVSFYYDRIVTRPVTYKH